MRRIERGTKSTERGARDGAEREAGSDENGERAERGVRSNENRER